MKRVLLLLVALLMTLLTPYAVAQAACHACHVSDGWENVSTSKKEVAICRQSVGSEISAPAMIAGHQGLTIKPVQTFTQMTYQSTGSQIIGPSTAAPPAMTETSPMVAPLYLQTAWNSDALATPWIAGHL